MELDEAWDSGQLGQDEQHVKKAAPAEELAVDEQLELQMISIRLPKSLIEDFKMLANYHGTGYQPLMREILKRFAEGEKRQIIQDMIREKSKAEQSAGADGSMAAEKKCA